MASVYIKTYGCQMNKRDSEAFAAELVAHGYSLSAAEEEADIILLNTCSVRDGAEQKALGKMQMLLGQTRLKRSRGKKCPRVFGIIGCAAQARGGEANSAKELLTMLPGLNLVLGTHCYHKLPKYVEQLWENPETPIVDCSGVAEAPVFFSQHLRQDAPQESLPEVVQSTRNPTAFVNIMHGCNQHCTYCIVPETRGHEFSRSIEEVVAECRALVQSGVREITLLGQIVTSFGCYGSAKIPNSADGHTPFVQLLDAIHEIDGLERIRFTAPHPKGYGMDLVEAYGRLPKLCPWAHIPVQSGSDTILKAMHRGYTAERFLEILEQLRKVQPQIGIATDIIVGFPGETEKDFQATLDVVRASRFDSAFLFKYSPRQNTPAAVMPNQVPMEVREERHARLMALVNEIAAENYATLVGQTVEVLVEGTSRRNVNRLQGRSRCNKIVLFEGSQDWVGSIRKFRVSRTGQYSLYGEPISEEKL